MFYNKNMRNLRLIEYVRFKKKFHFNFSLVNLVLKDLFFNT